VVTAVAIEQDTLLLGFGDGTVGLWRVSGADGLAALISWPALRSRPRASIRMRSLATAASIRPFRPVEADP
jgi:hypothetical protein